MTDLKYKVIYRITLELFSQYFLNAWRRVGKDILHREAPQTYKSTWKRRQNLFEACGARLYEVIYQLWSRSVSTYFNSCLFTYLYSFVSYILSFDLVITIPFCYIYYGYSLYHFYISKKLYHFCWSTSNALLSSTFFHCISVRISL